MDDVSNPRDLSLACRVLEKAQSTLLEGEPDDIKLAALQMTVLAERLIDGSASPADRESISAVIGTR